MSREIVAFGAWSLAASAYVTATVAQADSAARMLLWGMTCLAGAIAVGCSAMIYVATRRDYWSLPRTVPRFFITAALLGLATCAAVEAWTRGHVEALLLASIAAVTACRCIADHGVFRHGDVQEETPLARSARLLTGPLASWERCQAFAALVGGILLPLIALAQPEAAAALAAVSMVLLLAAEVVHRGLFFAAVSPPRMPGVSHP